MVAGSLVILTLGIAAWTLLVENALMVAQTGTRRFGDGGRTGHSRRHDRSDAATAGNLHRTCRGRANILLYRCRDCPFYRAQVGGGSPRVEFDTRRPSLFTLSMLSIVVIYVQLILGGMFRHHGMSWWPHVAHAAVVAFVLTWTAIRALSVYSNIEAIRGPAILMLSLADRAALPWLCRVPDARCLGS